MKLAEYLNYLELLGVNSALGNSDDVRASGLNAGGIRSKILEFKKDIFRELYSDPDTCAQSMRAGWGVLKQLAVRFWSQPEFHYKETTFDEEDCFECSPLVRTPSPLEMLWQFYLGQNGLKSFLCFDQLDKILSQPNPLGQFSTPYEFVAVFCDVVEKIVSSLAKIP